MRKIVAVFFASILLLAGAFVQGEETQNNKADAGKIVAKVNGAPIYEKELNESLALRFNKRKKFGFSSNTSPEVDYAIKMQVLDELIDSAVLSQAALSEKDLPDVEEQVNQKILSLANTFGSEENYAEFLKTKNTSLEKKKEYFRTSFLIQAYFDKKGLTNPEIPEEEIKALYEDQKKSFRIPERVKYSQVFIKAGKDASPEQKKKARALAEKAKKMLEDGKSFPEVTKELTEQAGDLEITGGDRDYVNKGVLPVKVEEVAFSIMPWKISDVIESKFGYHVLMIRDKKPAEYSPYEKVRDFLLRYLQTEAVRKNVAKHTRELREKAKIEIFLKKPETTTGNAETPS